MAHDHAHHHDHSMALTHVNKAFVIGIVLNFLFVLIETVAGLYTHSLSLLSDAGHNLADVASLALSLLAFRLLKVRSNERYTYGYRKTSILVALFNGAILLFSLGAILYEALHRVLNPEPLPGATISIVAGAGIVVNGVTALLFLRNKDKDLNIKSAYLHLVSDALVSFGIVIGGVIIYYTQWFWVDSVLSIAIALVILFSTWSLLKHSLRLSLDGVPVDIDLKELKSDLLKIPGVQDIRHIHVWAISTSENAITAHLVLAQDASIEDEKQVKDAVRHEILHHNIHHITIETERGTETFEQQNCDSIV